jgi:hypothetical protein
MHVLRKQDRLHRVDADCPPQGTKGTPVANAGRPLAIMTTDGAGATRRTSHSRGYGASTLSAGESFP